MGKNKSKRAAKNQQKQAKASASKTSSSAGPVVDYEIPFLEEDEFLAEEELGLPTQKANPQGIVVATVKTGDKLHFHKILTIDPTTGQPIRILEYNEKEKPIQEKLPLVKVAFTFGDYRGRLTATDVKTVGDISNADSARKIIRNAPKLKEMFLSDWYAQAAVGKEIPILGIIGEKVIYV